MRKNRKILIPCLFITILAAYLLLLFQWNFFQFSDFLNYYNEALSFKYHKQLDAKYLFFQAPGHPVIMSLWMTLLDTDSEKYLQWINVIQYVFVIWIVFESTKMLTLKFRILGVIGLVICVSYVSLLGFLCAEFNFLLFFVIANYLLIQLITNEKLNRKRKYYLILGIGISFGIAQFIRPLSLYYFLFFIVGMLFVKYLVKEKSTSPPANHYLFIAFFVFLITTFSLYKITIGHWHYQPSQNGLWSVFVGLNVKSAGRYNAEDIQKLEKFGKQYQWQGDSLRNVLKEQIKGRYKLGLANNLAHSLQRATYLLVPYYTSYWFFEKGLPYDKKWIPFMKIIFIFSTIWCLLSQIINFWYFIRFFSKGVYSNIEVFIFCSLGSMYLYLILHITLLEIQPRYAAHLMFINLWISTFVLSKILSKNKIL